MNISFKVLGFEIASVNVDVDLVDLFTDESPAASPLDKGIAKVSTWWVSRGMKK